ncbi:hypothetical protein A203_16560 [Chromobacterium violaceum]|uniref:hypothetical protein n=1 Tax=Chromobacterium violaceum TaxID=536 RepID=UPI003CEA4C25
MDEIAKALTGKTIEWAGVVVDDANGEMFVIRFADGGECKVVPYYREGYEAQVDVVLPDHPQSRLS